MKRTIALFLLSLYPAWGTVSIVQFVGPQNTNCSSSTTNCVVNVTSTGTGNVGVIFYHGHDQYLSSISPGTWTAPAASQANNGGGSVYLQFAYTFSLPSGQTSFTVNPGTSTFGRAIAFFEVSFTGVACYDTGGNSYQSSSVSSTTAPSMTLAHSGNHVFFQGAIDNANTTISSLATPTYTMQQFNNVGVLADGAGYLANVSSYSAPTWTAGAAGPWTMPSLALYESGFTGCTPVAMPQIVDFFERSIRGYLAILTPRAAFPLRASGRAG